MWGATAPPFLPFLTERRCGGVRFLRDISSYLLIFLFVLCYWYCSVHSLGWLPGGELLRSILLALLPFGCGMVLGRHIYRPKAQSWSLLLDVVLIVIMLPFAFTELAVFLFGPTGFLGRLARMAEGGSVRVLLLVLTGVLAGRLLLPHKG